MLDSITGFFDIVQLVEWFRELGPWGVIMAAATMIACAMTALPAEVSALANTIVYGPFWGAILSWASALAGANLAYLIARGRGGAVVRRWFGEARMAEAEAWVNGSGVPALLLAHAIPLIPFFALNYAAGVAGLRWTTFNWTTGVGIAPCIIILAVLGDQAFTMHWSVWLGVAALFAAMLGVLKLMSRRPALVPAI